MAIFDIPKFISTVEKIIPSNMTVDIFIDPSGYVMRLQYKANGKTYYTTSILERTFFIAETKFRIKQHIQHILQNNISSLISTAIQDAFGKEEERQEEYLGEW